jgi:transglutaminase-like putative cysteine protease
LITWLLGFIGTFKLVRENNPWYAIFSASLMLIMVDSFLEPEKRSVFLTGCFIFFSLLLIYQVFSESKKVEWLKKNISIDSEKGLRVNNSLILTIAFLTLFVWNLPVVIKSFSPATKENHELTELIKTIRDRFQDATAPLRGENEQQIYGFGKTLALGLSTSQDQEIIFRVNSTKTLPLGTHFYWRTWIYDYYDENLWRSQATAFKTIRPNEVIELANDLSDKELASLRVFVYEPLGVFISVGIPHSINSRGELYYSLLEREQMDIHSLVPSATLENGDEFLIESWIAVPTQEELINAGRNYPDWVREKYLQLPGNLPARIRNLARDITKDYETAFEKTTAITNYLRDNITYRDSIIFPPVDKDLIEWFLFEYKQGFCNYYATAEVLLLRSIGIPARLANGYAEGEVLPDGRSFLVRSINAHAWPEVYFPGFGWIQFEPTSNLPEQVFEKEPDVVVLETVQVPTINPLGMNGELKEESKDDQLPLENSISRTQTVEQERNNYPILVVVIICAGSIIWIRQRKNSPHPLLFAQFIKNGIIKLNLPVPSWINRWIFFSELSPMERSFRNLLQYWRFLGYPEILNGTPKEQLTNFTKMVPSLKGASYAFLVEYEKATYSNHKSDMTKARTAASEIRSKIILNRLSNLKFLKKDTD